MHMWRVLCAGGAGIAIASGSRAWSDAIGVSQGAARARGGAWHF